MKKKFAWIILLVMLLTGCTVNDSAKEPDAETGETIHSGFTAEDATEEQNAETGVTFPSESTDGDCVEAINVEEWKPFHTYQEVLQTPNGYYAKYEGFVNTEEYPIHSANDALELAKKECTVPYNCISYWYYEEEDIWYVMFHEENTAGGNQDVYLGSDGITRLIIYGE